MKTTKVVQSNLSKMRGSMETYLQENFIDEQGRILTTVTDYIGNPSLEAPFLVDKKTGEVYFPEDETNGGKCRKGHFKVSVLEAQPPYFEVDAALVHVGTDNGSDIYYNITILPTGLSDLAIKNLEQSRNFYNTNKRQIKTGKFIR